MKENVTPVNEAKPAKYEPEPFVFDELSETAKKNLLAIYDEVKAMTPEDIQDLRDEVASWGDDWMDLDDEGMAKLYEEDLKREKEREARKLARRKAAEQAAAEIQEIADNVKATEAAKAQ